MDEPLENLYFNWLCAKVTLDPRREEEYWCLLRKLHTTEFAWFLIGDDNRAEDGKELRREFLLQADIPDNVEWRTVLGCSVLEMLIALGRRGEWLAGGHTYLWFWRFIENLGLSTYTDPGYDDEFVSLVLEDLVWRRYQPNGEGGIFPIRNPSEDQRQVEIWYQFSEYLAENDTPF